MSNTYPHITEALLQKLNVYLHRVNLDPFERLGRLKFMTQMSSKHFITGKSQVKIVNTVHKYNTPIVKIVLISLEIASNMHLTVQLLIAPVDRIKSNT